MTRQGTGHTARARAEKQGRAPKPRAKVVGPAFRWEGDLPEIVFGIDPGVSTGLSRIELGMLHGRLKSVESMSLHEAMANVRFYVEELRAPESVLVVFEDARLRTWFGNAGREQLQGAGSIKRDCGIWADYLRSLGVRFHGISPEAKGPKLNAAQFARRFGWTERTNEHSRDAGLVAAYGAALVGMRVDYLAAREGH